MWWGCLSFYYVWGYIVWGWLGWFVGVELSKWLRDRYLWRVYRWYGGGWVRIWVELMVVNWCRCSGLCYYGWVFIVVFLIDGCWGRVVVNFVLKNLIYGVYRGNVVFIIYFISKKFVFYFLCKYFWILFFVYFDMFDYIWCCYVWFIFIDSFW